MKSNREPDIDVKIWPEFHVELEYISNDVCKYVSLENKDTCFDLINNANYVLKLKFNKENLNNTIRSLRIRCFVYKNYTNDIISLKEYSNFNNNVYEIIIDKNIFYKTSDVSNHYKEIYVHTLNYTDCKNK